MTKRVRELEQAAPDPREWFACDDLARTVLETAIALDLSVSSAFAGVLFWDRLEGSVLLGSKQEIDSPVRRNEDRCTKNTLVAEYPREKGYAADQSEGSCHAAGNEPAARPRPPLEGPTKPESEHGRDWKSARTDVSCESEDQRGRV